MRPMLATRGDDVPSGDEWLHEVKWDGFRVLVEVSGGRVHVTSRTERDVTVALPEFAGLADLPDGLVLDGELVVFEGGVPVIQGVAERFQVRSPQRAATLAELYPATLVAFDLLMCMGELVVSRPIEERRALLEVLPLTDTGVAQISPTYQDGPALLQAVQVQGLEGIVSKRARSIYRPGIRSTDWLKFPIREVASFVVGGYRLEREGARIGSLLIGEPGSDGLQYRGRVALSVPARVARAIADQLSTERAESAPFVDVPEEDASDAHWVTPSTVIDVEFLKRTSDGRLRHPTFVTQRIDLSPDELA
ncbi:MAG TPA: DNA ligase [Marmoricola sp.]|nr:DNA ligase [Marmoricola sp.]